MVMKNNGREKQRKQHRIRTCKCKKCKNQINLEEKLELHDYEKVGDYYIFYCEKCGQETDLIKL